jgi:hypothetical protein
MSDFKWFGFFGVLVLDWIDPLPPKILPYPALVILQFAVAAFFHPFLFTRLNDTLLWIFNSKSLHYFSCMHLAFGPFAHPRST